MKKIFMIALISIFSINLTFAQTAESILKEHYEVMGSKKMASMKTMTMSGKMMQMNFEIPVKMYVENNKNFRLEGTMQGMTFVQVCSPEKGWKIAPWTGSTDPDDMSEEELKSSVDQLDIAGSLYDYKSKGHTVTYEGKVDMEGTSCYKLKLDKKSGESETYYLDADAYVIIKQESTKVIKGTKITSESILGNYKEVDGVVMAFQIENRMNGNSAGKIVIENISFDQKLDKELFVKPAPKNTK